jgi:hypothetical protein
VRCALGTLVLLSLVTRLTFLEIVFPPKNAI